MTTENRIIELKTKANQMREQAKFLDDIFEELAENARKQEALIKQIGSHADNLRNYASHYENELIAAVVE